ncbi:M6 family metalloprotease domain-containing protein [Candidatus Poribacteria bacterium]
MKNCRLHLPGLITLTMLMLYSLRAAAVPPDPTFYGVNTGIHTLSASRYIPKTTEAPAPPLAAPAIGSQEIVVILIEFQDVTHNPDHDKAYFDDLLFSTSNPNSMYNYYYEASYGQMSISGFITGWYLSSHNMSYYGADGGETDNLNGSVYELTREAVILADAAGFDFSRYDKDGDGDVDHIIVVHAGPAQEAGGRSYGPDAIWSHHWSVLPYEQVDGVSASYYSMVAESSPLGTIAHEYGHDLGLPDLYDTDGSSAGIGSWGIMGLGAWLSNGDVPSHFCAWSKVFVGWVNPKEVTADQQGLDLSCVESSNLNTIVKIPLTPNEYFLVENRCKTGFDQYLPGSGILIWHIDDSVGDINSGYVNDDESHKRVDLEEADGHDDLDINANYGDTTDPYYPGNSISFGDSTVPSSDLYSGESSVVSITNISGSSAAMTLDISRNTNTASVQEATIALEAGWNLISLCLQPIDTSLSSVLSSIAGTYDSVWTYDAVTEQWHRYVVGSPPFLNNLAEMESGVGYWLMMNQPATLIVQGTPPTTVISLKAGWNLVGYSSRTSMPVEDCPPALGNRCNSIWTYNSEAGEWLRYDANVPAFLNTLESLQSGSGYWIRADQDFVWYTGHL